MKFAALDSTSLTRSAYYYEQTQTGWDEEFVASTQFATVRAIEKPDGQAVVGIQGTSSVKLFFEQAAGWTQAPVVSLGNVTLYQGFEMKANAAGQLRLAAPVRRNFGDNGYRVLHAREEDNFAFDVVHFRPDQTMAFDAVNLQITPQGRSVLSYIYNNEVRLAVPDGADWRYDVVDWPRLIDQPGHSNHIDNMRSTILPDGRLVYVYENQKRLTVTEQTLPDATPAP